MFLMQTFCTDSLASHDIFSLTKYVTSFLQDYFILSIKVLCFSPEPQLFLCIEQKLYGQVHKAYADT